MVVLEHWLYSITWKLIKNTEAQLCWGKTHTSVFLPRFPGGFAIHQSLKIMQCSSTKIRSLWRGDCFLKSHNLSRIYNLASGPFVHPSSQEWARESRKCSGHCATGRPQAWGLKSTSMDVRIEIRKKIGFLILSWVTFLPGTQDEWTAIGLSHWRDRLWQKNALCPVKHSGRGKEKFSQDTLAFEIWVSAAWKERGGK